MPPHPTLTSLPLHPRLEDEMQKREDAEQSLVLFRKVRLGGGVQCTPCISPTNWQRARGCPMHSAWGVARSVLGGGGVPSSLQSLQL